MKIKNFISFNENFNDDLLDFCKNHLSYLIDDGIDIEINNIDTNSFYHKEFTKIQGERLLEIAISDTDWIYWKNIKDEFVQFLSSLNNNYTINGVSVESVTRTHKYTVDEILSGVDIINLIATIAIYIEK